MIPCQLHRQDDTETGRLSCELRIDGGYRFEFTKQMEQPETRETETAAYNLLKLYLYTETKWVKSNWNYKFHK